VKCTAGAVWDVAVDLRPESETFRSWAGVELSAQSHTMLYVAEWCAHGYLSLTDGSEIRYLTSQFYEPDAATGVRYDDPALGIDWPAEVRLVSDRDREWPLLAQGSYGSSL
jgi:dTDP-4-dehydrorhamnose 3,5-epimerase